MKTSQRIDGRDYVVEVRELRAPSRPDFSLVMSSHDGLSLTQAAIESIRAFARGSYELWVVDNASVDGTQEYLMAQADLNVVLNRTPAWTDRAQWLARMGVRRRRSGASYSNAIALELGARVARGRWMFVLQNDILVLDPAWLPFVRSRLSEQVRGVAMSIDHVRVNAMHSSGFCFDLELLKRLGLSFLPALPTADCADRITIALRRAGYSYYVCANTFNRPETEMWIAADHPFRHLPCDRVFDEERRLMWAHLGRGTLKIAGTYLKTGKTSAQEWLRAAGSLVTPSGRDLSFPAESVTWDSGR